jgi:hypothetical protein
MGGIEPLLTIKVYLSNASLLKVEQTGFEPADAMRTSLKDWPP